MGSSDDSNSCTILYAANNEDKLAWGLEYV